VIVALGTASGETEPGRRHGGGAIDRVKVAVFLVNGAALARRHIAADESRRDKLISRRPGQEIPRELPGRELIVGEIVIEGFHDPVAVGPHLSLVVEVKAVGVAIPRHIEPVTRHFLTEARRLQIAIDHRFIGPGRGILFEGVHLRLRRRQPGEGEGDAPNPGGAIGLGLESQLLLREPRREEGIYRDGGRFRDRRLHRSLQRPVSLVNGTLFDPSLESVLLRVGQGLVRLRRRHDCVGIIGEDARPGFTLRRISRHDRLVASEIRVGTIGGVETQVGFACLPVKTVAGEAVFRKDGPDVAVETERRSGSE